MHLLAVVLFFLQWGHYICGVCVCVCVCVILSQYESVLVAQFSTLKSVTKY